MGMIYIVGLLEGCNKIPRYRGTFYLPGKHCFLCHVGVD